MAPEAYPGIRSGRTGAKQRVEHRVDLMRWSAFQKSLMILQDEGNRPIVPIRKRVKLWIKWNRLGMSLRSRGLRGTASHFIERIAEIRFDISHRVETNTKIPAYALGIECGSHANEYTPVPTRALARVLARLPIDYAEWDFVDLGAGKGRAMLVASRFAFRKIVGVELSAELVQIATRNFGSFRDSRQKCFELNVLNEDARRYHFSNSKIVLYLFDPFNHPGGMERVLRNIQKWLDNSDHEIYLIYWHPRLKHAFNRFPTITLIRATPEYCLYRAHSE